MATTKKDIQSIQDVQLMVDTFYSKVRDNALLSPVFSDLANTNWETHLPKMYSFWSSILLDSNEYRGRPFDHHAPYADFIRADHFDAWLALFSETVDQLFLGEKAELAKQRAQSIAAIFQYKLDFIRSNKK